MATVADLVEDWAELNALRGFSPRQQRLFYLEALYEETVFDHLRPWSPPVQDVGGVQKRVPCRERKPSILLGLIRDKVDKLADKLIGEGRFPSLEGDKQLLALLTEQLDVEEALVNPTADLIVKGSCALGFHRLDSGRYEAVYLDTVFCEPVFAAQAHTERAAQLAEELANLGVPLQAPAAGQHLAVPEGAESHDLVMLRYEYIYDEEQAVVSGGQARRTVRWRKRRDYLPNVIVEYQDVRIGETDDRAPSFELAAPPRPHNWGVVPIAWARARRARPGAPDGPSLITPALASQAIAADYTASRKDSSVGLSADPQLYTIDVRDLVDDINAEAGHSIQPTGSDEVLQFQSIGPSPKVGLLEPTGEGHKAAGEQLEALKDEVERVSGIVDLDPGDSAGAESGVAIERRMEPTIARVKSYRKPLTRLLKSLAMKLGKVAGRPGELTVSWPRVVPTTSADVQAAATALTQATGGQAVLSQETAVEQMANVLELAKPQDEMKRLKQDADDAMARARAAFDDGAGE